MKAVLSFLLGGPGLFRSIAALIGALSLLVKDPGEQLALQHLAAQVAAGAITRAALRAAFAKFLAAL